MTHRKIVEIDEAKCNGCGECVPSCAEGAIQIIDGKARLVSDVYCDGLGACLGHCPQGAITVTEREAEPFDEGRARQHPAVLVAGTSGQAEGSDPLATLCAGKAVQDLSLNVLPMAAPAARDGRTVGPSPVAASGSALRNWPVQLRLVPPDAPFLRDAEVLLVANCVPFALADFHERLLRGRAVLIACPKLDDTRPYVEKLAQIVNQSAIRRLTVIRMEVPCCAGLLRLAEAALKLAGRTVPLDQVVISIRGQVVEERKGESNG
jgi:ferredoxin